MASRVYGHVIDPGGNVIGRVRDLKGGDSPVGLRVDVRGMEEVAARLQQTAKLVPQAAAAALTDTAQQTRTAVKAALVEQTGLPSAEVLKALKVAPASAGYLSAAIVATGAFTRLAKFKARQTRKGVSAAPWGERRVFPHTFMIAAYGGNVYKRAGKARFPLHALYGPAIPKEAVKGQSATAFYGAVPAVLARRLAHYMSRIFS